MGEIKLPKKQTSGPQSPLFCFLQVMGSRLWVMGQKKTKVRRTDKSALVLPMTLNPKIDFAPPFGVD